MFEMILGFVLKVLGGPLVEAYKAKLASGTTHETLAQGLALQELQLQNRQNELNTQYKIALIGHWYEPANLASYICVAFLCKVVVVDTMLGLGVTPALKGDVAVWFGMIMTFLFGKRGIENVAMIWNKK